MKTIKDSKSIRVCTFVFVLMLILSLSSMMGSTVWAKKPSHPQPEAADFEIRIGEGSGAQDIRLNPPDSVLYVENEVGGYWLPPPTKGKEKAQKERSWGITLLGETGDDCGEYNVGDVSGDPPYEDVVLSEVLADAVNLGAVYFSIEHVHTRVPRVGERDYWLIWIGWQVDTFLGIVGRTNIDAEWEGTYDEIADTWTVTFNNAEFGLIENDGSGAMSELWVGQLSFTVEIKRTLSWL